MAGNVVEELIKSIQQEPKKQSRAVSAVVARIDGEGVVWVRLAGSEQETPTASVSAEVKPGDVVTVEWRNKKLYIGGNYSNPSVGIQRILITEENMNAATNLLGTFDKKVDNFMRITGDTTQYFWHTETGTDTGAHITEIPKDDFLTDPTNGGSNLLARSNGIAVRDGLAELAMFGANGIQIGQSGQSRTVIGAHLIQMIDGTDDAAYSYNPSGYFTVVSGRDNVIYNKYQSEVEPNESYSSTVRTYTLSDWYDIADTNKFYFTYGLKDTSHPYITSVTCNFERGTLKSYTNYGITCAYDGNNTITMSSSGSSSEYGGLIYYTYDIERTAPGCIIGRLLEQYGLGDYATSAGYNNEVIGQYAFGTGFQNRVCGQADHVTGTNNFSSGGNCHVEGAHNEVTGSCSHAEGEYVRVSGQHAHGSGLGTVVSSDNQTVIGKYNVEDTNDDYAFVVGNGTDEDNRSNALTVGWDGSITSAAGSSTRFTFSSNVSGAVNPLAYGYKDNVAKTVRIYFTARYNSNVASGTTIFTVPEGYRPSVNSPVMVAIRMEDGSMNPAYLTINTSGAIVQNFTSFCRGIVGHAEYSI